MSQWIRVAASESQDSEAVEIELDGDGTLRLTELNSQFPGATGLRYRNPDTGMLRAVKTIWLQRGPEIAKKKLEIGKIANKKFLVVS